MHACQPSGLCCLILLLALCAQFDCPSFAAEQKTGPPATDARPQRARHPDEAEHAIFGFDDRYLVAGRLPPTKLINLWFDTQPVDPSNHLWQLCQPLGALRFAEDGTPAGLPEMLRDHCFQANPRLGWLREYANPNKPGAAVFLTQMLRKRNVPDADWARITSVASAAKPHLLDRDPRLAENWFAALESGRSHDDYRFRRAAYVHVGQGYRLTHTASMELSVVAHGLPMVLDVQRGVGSTRWTPKYGLLQVHNGIEVNGDGGYGPKDEKGWDVLEQLVCQWSWIHTLADAEGARFLSARTIPPPLTTAAMRQVALIDVDEGQGSQPPSIVPPAVRCTRTVSTARLTTHSPAMRRTKGPAKPTTTIPN